MIFDSTQTTPAASVAEMEGTGTLRRAASAPVLELTVEARMLAANPNGPGGCLCQKVNPSHFWSDQNTRF